MMIGRVNMAEKKKTESFSAEERAAMKERAKELKANATKEAGLQDALAKIAEMPEADRKIGERLHAVITAAAPSLDPKTWYGQPAYALDGQVVVFFQSADKFGTRYSTLGFSENAKLDEGSIWPTSYAIASLTDADEKFIAELVKKAVG